MSAIETLLQRKLTLPAGFKAKQLACCRHPEDRIDLGNIAPPVLIRTWMGTSTDHDATEEKWYHVLYDWFRRHEGCE